MAKTLKPFGYRSNCPKCRNSGTTGLGIETTWVPKRISGRINCIAFKALQWLACLTDAPGQPSGVSLEEHIMRKCCLCGFCWGEFPADYPSPLEQLANQAE